MLNFKNEFNNDDPLSNLDELLALNTVGAALLLVLGNLAGIATFLYARLIGSYFLSYAILASVVVSFFYHLCQTTHECFQFPLTKWVATDHFTATVMMGLVLLSTFNVRTVCQLIHKRHVIRTVEMVESVATTPCARKSEPACVIIDQLSREPEYDRTVFEPDLCGCGQEMANHFAYGRVEENLIYDEWSSASVFVVVTTTVVAVNAHPFSYAAFNIVIGVCGIAAYLYVCLLQEGEPKNFEGRISWPELIISVVLSVIGLVAYVLDSYVEYMWLHSVWHVAIYLGLMFWLAGTMKSVNGWVPLYAPCCRFVASYCCYAYEEEEYVLFTP